MRPVIRHLLTPDTDPPESYVPEDPERFMFLVQMLAGPEGEEGEESFQFVVCSPGWLGEHIRQNGPVSGRHHIIVDHYDWPALVAYFEALVAGCHGANWHEAAERLARYGWWEFEDYTP
jgi:hypothetical protein